MSRLTVGIIAGLLAVLAVAAGGISYLAQPHHAASRFTLSPSPSAVTASPSALAGTWVVDTGSLAGYRVRERFFNQRADTEAVARTSAMSGQVVLASGVTGLELRNATFAADISKLQSTDANATYGPRAVRDKFVALNYLNTAIYPQAAFVAAPLSLTVTGAPASLTVPGSFTVHGVTHQLSIPLQVSQDGDRLEVVGTFQVHYQDYRVDVPAVPFTTVAPDATVEVHLFLRRQS
jgi:polyisoprenoid-binding protein YceI